MVVPPVKASLPNTPLATNFNTPSGLLPVLIKYWIKAARISRVPTRRPAFMLLAEKMLLIRLQVLELLVIYC